MKHRLLFSSLLSLLIVVALAGVAFASYHPNRHQPVVSKPTRHQSVTIKRTVRVVKYRKVVKTSAVRVPARQAYQGSSDRNQSTGSGLHSNGRDDRGEDHSKDGDERGEYDGEEYQGSEREDGDD